MRRSPQILGVLSVQKAPWSQKSQVRLAMLVSYSTLARRSMKKPTNGRISARGTLGNLARHLITARRRPR